MKHKLRPFLLPNYCHREGEARGDPLAINTRTDNPSALPETRWIAASLASLPPRNDKVKAPITSFLHGETTPPCHREGEARGDPL